jgi:hypothetical protein
MIGNARTRTSDRIGRPLIRSPSLSRFFYPLVPLTRSLPSIHTMRSPASSELKEAATGSSAASSAPDQRRLPPEEMAPGSSVVSFASGMPPHTSPTLLLSRAPVHHCIRASEVGQPMRSHARSGPVRGLEELLQCAGRAV